MELRIIQKSKMAALTLSIKTLLSSNVGSMYNTYRDQPNIGDQAESITQNTITRVLVDLFNWSLSDVAFFCKVVTCRDLFQSSRNIAQHISDVEITKKTISGRTVLPINQDGAYSIGNSTEHINCQGMLETWRDIAMKEYVANTNRKTSSIDTTFLMVSQSLYLSGRYTAIQRSRAISEMLRRDIPRKTWVVHSPITMYTALYSL